MIDFGDLVTLYRQTTFTTNYTVGTIYISTVDLCTCISDALAQPQDFGITLQSGTVQVGNTVTLHFSTPKIKFGQVHATFKDYIKNSKNRIKEAKSYYIFEDDYYNNDQNHPSHIIKYRLILRLVSLFKESAAYLDESNCELVFLETNVTKIPVTFDSIAIKSLDEEKVKNLLASFSIDAHRDIKLTILANTIKSMSDTKPKESAFIYLISDMTQLCESFNKGYGIYISGFSYEKVLDQLRVAKIEEMGKIHKVFSDIQNQLLGIPVATIIVATQMKEANGWDSQALINTAVILGSIFFTAMIIFVMFNQWQTLSAISDEINHQKNQAEIKCESIYSDIQKTFESLRSRIFIQKAIFIALAAFVVVGILLTLKFYFFLTPYAQHYIFG